MSTPGGAARVARSGRAWLKRVHNKRALDKFAEFWSALQRVGDVLAEIERVCRKADDSTWKRRNERHWSIASVDEVKSAVKRCRSSLRIVSAQAKRFEPELIVKDWRR